MIRLQGNSTEYRDLIKWGSILIILFYGDPNLMGAVIDLIRRIA